MTPNLGCATSEELLRELICRFKIDATCTPSISSLAQTERALVLAEMVGAMSASDREYRTAEA